MERNVRREMAGVLFIILWKFVIIVVPLYLYCVGDCWWSEIKLCTFYVGFVYIRRVHAVFQELAWITSFIIYFYYFILLSLLKKLKLDYEINMLSVWLRVYIYVSLFWTFDSWTSPHETLYMYHDSWFHLNGVRHKSLPLFFVSVCASLYRC
jgi:hypothetical protein